MLFEHVGLIELPVHTGPGAFDHAAVHRASARVYIAHTSNHAVDVVDGTTQRYLHSIRDLTGVAGALVSDERDLGFTSNRGENTIGLFTPRDDQGVFKIPVGIRPNGLAFDPQRNLLLVANVGDPAIPHSCTLSIVDVVHRKLTASIPVPGRTRWTVFDQRSDCFYVNIAEPPQIVVVAAGNPTRVERVMPIPVAGPHGLDLDAEGGVLFCACDSKWLLAVDARSGAVLEHVQLAGGPDVIFFNASRRRLYVAIGDPGVLEVYATAPLRLVETVMTEKGAHTMAFDSARSRVYALLPQTYRAAVYVDAAD